ncbi:MAG TPA: exonuclease subunit SbcD [Ktedonobacteraceae bacterium]|nr:exonuclease subunit SbcD [Ktedonobacteraceae bacterium]
MRILHTADWHLNEYLKGVPRQPDIAKRLEEIAGYLDEHKVDVMVVAGDIFSQGTRMVELNEAINDVNRIFKPFLLKGGSIVGISGNHDNEDFFSIMRSILDMATPIDPRATGPRPQGRLYLATRPTVLELADKSGQSIQFVLLPYPTPARYLRDDNIHYQSLAQRNELLHEKFKSKLESMQRTMVKDHLRSVMVAHIHVRGMQVHTHHHVSESDDVIFDQGEIPAHWDYVAYGHIHKPQLVWKHTPHVRYAGSIERLNYGERDDDKSIVLVDIGPDGRRADPICLPLKATPIYRVEIVNPETDMQGLRERYPDHEQALVSYRLVYKPGEHNLESLMDELKQVFPRSYESQIEAEGAQVSLNTFDVTAPHDFAGTVESYLQEKLADHPQHDELLRLAQALLATIE